MSQHHSSVQVHANTNWSESDTHQYVNCIHRYNNRDEMWRDDCNVVTDSEASYCEVGEGWRDSWPGRDGRQADGQTICSAGRHEEGPNTSSRIAAERDALASALASERARSEREARAHDARLAELHGVIAELVRRRDRQAARRAIPEEPDEEQENDEDLELCDSEATLPAQDDDTPDNTEHHNQETLSPKDEELLTTGRPSNPPMPKGETTDKHTNRQIVSDGSVQCSRSYSPAEVLRYPEAAVAGRCAVSVASRVQLNLTTRQCRVQKCSGAEADRADRAVSELSEHEDADVGRGLAAAAAGHTEVCVATLALANARAERYAADCTALEAALAHATDTAQRLSLLCARHESCSVALSEALRASDRAVEAYDVLLALAETRHESPAEGGEGRAAAVCVARALLHRLQRECEGAHLLPGRPLLSPGPWQDDMSGVVSPENVCEWSAHEESSLRAHVSRLKAHGTRARLSAPPPTLDEHYAVPGETCSCRREHCSGVCTLPATGALYQDMETAVLLQEIMVAREERAAAIVALQAERKRNTHCHATHQQNVSSEVMTNCHGSSPRYPNTNKDGATDKRKRKSRQRKHRDHLHYSHTHAHAAPTHTHAHCRGGQSEKQYAGFKKENLLLNNEHIGSTKKENGSQNDLDAKVCVNSLEGDIGGEWEKIYFTKDEYADTGSEKDPAGSEKLFVGSLKEYSGMPKDYASLRRGDVARIERDNIHFKEEFIECSQMYVGSQKDCSDLTKDCVQVALTKDVSCAMLSEDSSKKNSWSPPDVCRDSSAETFQMSSNSNNFDSSPHKELSDDEIVSPTFRQNSARYRSGSLRTGDDRVTRVHAIANKKLNLSSQNLRTASETNL